MTKDYVVQLSAGAMADELVAQLTQPVTQTLFASEIRLNDKYCVETPAGNVISLVFSPWYARIRGFVTLIVTLCTVAGVTRVHVTTGGQMSTNQDLGAGSSFVKRVEQVLQPHVKS